MNQIEIKIDNKVEPVFIVKDRFNGSFRVDRVIETLSINLDNDSHNYRVKFTGPSLTSTGKEHKTQRGEISFSERGSRFDDLHEMPAELRNLIQGRHALARKAGG